MAEYFPFGDVSIQDAFLFEESFTTADWHESITQGRTDTITPDRSMCTITIICDFAKYKAAVRYLLGYSWVSEGKKLKRELPAFHPVWPWLYARAVNEIRFAGPEGKETGIFEGTLPFGKYKYAMITAEFAEVDYKLKKDNEVTYEWERFLSVTPGSNVEQLQLDCGTMKAYAPNVTLPGINGNHPIGVPYVTARIAKNKYLLTWRNVPHEFLYDANDNAQKIEAIQKRINKTTWRGNPAGTLLCETCVANKKPQPLATDVFNDLDFHYDVELSIVKFDPKPGDPMLGKRGWNLLPGPRALESTSENLIGWYYYTDDGLATGKPLYEPYEFADFFTHRSL